MKLGAEHRTMALNIIKELSNDRAWRVRWSVAHRLSEIADALGEPATTSELLPALQRLLADAEVEVRTAASYRVTDLGKIVGAANSAKFILPALSKAVDDASDPVRAALSSVVLGMSAVLSAQVAVDMLLPICLKLIKDRSPSVRLAPRRSVHSRLAPSSHSLPSLSTPAGSPRRHLQARSPQPGHQSADDRALAAALGVRARDGQIVAHSARHHGLAARHCAALWRSLFRVIRGARRPCA
jgi:HEAT repeats